MSEASLPHCEYCGRVEYACECKRDICVNCGCELDNEAIITRRDMCFECYGRCQD
jgi:hypothetical protein